jgi:hypothetical protein
LNERASEECDLQELIGKTEMSVEPVYFSGNEVCRHEASLGEDLGDLSLLVGLEGKGRRFVATV